MEGEYRGKVRSTRDGRRGMTAVVWCPRLTQTHSTPSLVLVSPRREFLHFPTQPQCVGKVRVRHLQHLQHLSTRRGSRRLTERSPGALCLCSLTCGASSLVPRHRALCLITREPEYAPPTSRPFCTPAARAPLTVAFANAGANASPYTTSCDARDLRRVRAAHMARARDGARPPR